MGITVGQAASHYDVLGLTPAARAEEIEQAFARQLRRPRPFGEITQVSIAHEQLRDPVKRRAYDESLGLNQPSEPEPQPSTAGVAASRQRLFETAPISVAQRAAPAIRAAVPERNTGAFIASSLRSSPEPHVSQSEPAARAGEVSADPVVAAPAADAREVPQGNYQYSELSFPAAQDAQIPWKGISIAIGAMIAAGGLLGAWVSPSAPEASEPAASKPALTIPLPEAKPSTVAAVAVAIPDRPLARTQAPSRTPSTARRGQSRLAGIEQALSDGPVAQAADDSSEAVAEAPAAAAAETPAQAASLPLPDKVIARTIHQIGYSCGSVSSATAVDGESGVFKVTCTSGQSYRAAPVRGRYHFRRWNG